MTPEGDRALHARLLQEDPTAPSDLAVTYLGPLSDWLVRRFPRLDPDLLGSVADELIFSVAERPGQYDPSRRSLLGYLKMAAEGDVKNALQREQRRSHHQVRLEDVELVQPARNSGVEGTLDPAEVVMGALLVDQETLTWLRGHFDDLEWEIVRLQAQGERNWAVFADVLGLGELSETERRREVKRVTDRVKKRLRRLGPEMRDRD